MRVSTVVWIGLIVASAGPEVQAGQIVSLLSNKCMEMPRASTDDNAQLAMYTCYDQDHFNYDAVPSGDYFQLRFRHSQKCVGVHTGSNDSSAAIVQVPCQADVDSQLWRVEDGQQLVNKHSDKCTSVQNGNAKNGAPVVQVPCAVGVLSNLWKLDQLTLAEPSQPLEESYLQIINMASNKCMEMPFASTTDGSEVSQYSCYEQDHYQYSFEPMGDGYYHIRFRHSGKCVEINTNGDVVQNPCATVNNNAQLWKVNGPVDSQQIINKEGDMCLTLGNGGSRQNKTPILPQVCIGSSAQRWRFKEIERRPTGDDAADDAADDPVDDPVEGLDKSYQHIISVGNNRCAEMPRATKSNFAPLGQYRCLNEDHFSFLFSQNGDYYQIMFKHSEKCATVLNDSKKEGALIVQADCDGDDEQLWQVRGSTGRRQLIIKSTGMCMHVVPGGLSGASVSIVQSKCDQSPTKLWKLNDIGPVQRPENLVGRYLNIVSKHSGRCAEMPHASTAGGAGVGQYRCINDEHFQFYVIPKGEYYQIAFRHSDKCLDVSRDSSDEGAQLVQESCVGNAANIDSQFWKLVGRPGNYQIVNSVSNMCMNLENSSKSNGAKIIQSTCVSGSSSMSWDLEDVGRIAPTPAPAPIDPEPVPTPVSPPKETATWIETEQNESGIDVRHEACFVMVGKKAYLVGGRHSQNKDTNIYDPQTRKWSNGAKTPIELHHIQCVAAQGLLWLVAAWTGGYPREKNAQHIYVYDPATDEWSTRTAMPESRRRGGAAAVVSADEKSIYVAFGNSGGHERQGTNFAESLTYLDRYDIATDSWTSLADGKYPRDHTLGALMEDGRICVASGRDGGTFGWPDVAPTECYDIASDKWTVEEDLPEPRAGAAVASTCEGELMIAGGEGRGKAWDLVSVFDGSSWREADKLNVARHGTGLAVNCVCREIYIASGSGGFGGGPEINSVETYFMDGPSQAQVPCVMP